MARKTLLVYYSRSGTTRKVAEAIAAELRCDIEEIQDVRSRKGLFGWLRSGREAIRKARPEIKPMNKDPESYDLVIIGTPVWASTMASPVRTWLNANQKKLINLVALFCTMGGEDRGHAIPDMGEYCHCDSLASLAVRRKDVASGAFEQKVKDFVRQLS